MEAFEDLVARATADPLVLGLVLTGSHARGLATVHSDHDVYVIVARRSEPWSVTHRSPRLDTIICTVEELADTSVTWNRYSFRGARVLLDRLAGRIAGLVQAQAIPSAAEAQRWARDGLDAYINMIYRAAKSRRDGRVVEARLDEAESIPWLLMTLFALYGRIRPYNKYLRWELETFPLGEPWDAETLPERIADDPIGLFADIERLARGQGLGDVIDAWGGELKVLQRQGDRARLKDR